MVMRFHWGIAIGHLYTHDQNKLPTQTAAHSENASAAATAANTPIANRSVEQSNTFPTASEPDDWLRPSSAFQVNHDVPHAEYHLENCQENGWEGEDQCDVVRQAEFGLENRQDNDWEEDYDDGLHGGEGDDGWESDDDIFEAMNDMYGTHFSQV
jgi:hypothetical protein